MEGDEANELQHSKEVTSDAIYNAILPYLLAWDREEDMGERDFDDLFSVEGLASFLAACVAGLFR